MNKTLIEVKNLQASFDSRVVLKDVSFSVYENQVTIILGGSGSGKTTLLKYIIGLYKIQKGEISILGQQMRNIEENDKNNLYMQLGVFYQNGALINSLSVAENIALPLEQHSKLNKKLIDQLVRLKLELVKLEHAYWLFPSQLSGGMRKRAALARAIAMDPPLLFCDEPGAGLDPVSLAALDDLILKLKQQLNITVVMVTHEVESIKRLADRIIFLHEGKVVFEGPLKDALASDIPVLHNFFHDPLAKS